VRLHRGGKTREWLGVQLGGDYELGDRAYRRVLHMLGGLAVVYLVLPSDVFVVVSTEVVLLAALAIVLALEGLRHRAHWELPTIRPYESHRIASFAFYAVALVAALLLFPRPIAAAVILGTAFIDPLLGELRLRSERFASTAVLGGLAYAAIAFVAMGAFGGGWTVSVVGLALLAAVLAVTAEWPTWGPLDDDLAMTLVPGAVLTVLVALGPGLLR
jgi:dolichol kinase